MSAGLSDAIAYLQQSNDSGRSLFDHLSDVLLKLLEQRPARAYDAFEALSFELKKDAPVHSAAPAPPAPEPTAAQLGARDLLRAREDDGTVAATNDGDMPDVQEQLDAFEWAGVAVASREEAFRLIISMRRLLEREPLQSVRLWGKILGRESDYYVCESLYKEGAAEEAAGQGGQGGAQGNDSDLSDAEVEERAKKAAEEAAKSASETPTEKNTGANKYTYWVCRNAGEPWAKLPNVTPAQIKAARVSRKLLTGRLSAPVRMWPEFPGNEANLLRAQIARISAGTVVSPRGYYAPEENEDEDEEVEPTAVIESEEYTGLTPDVLIDAHNWVHHIQAVRMQGRCAPWFAPRQRAPGSGDEDSETEQEEDEDREQSDAPPNPEEAEVTPKLLSPVADDEPVNGKPAWTTKQGSRVAKQAPIFAFSNRWPGAVAVAYNGGAKFANIYVGYGLKYEDKPYTPQMPKVPEADEGIAAQFVEQNDPTIEEEKEVERQKAEEDERKRLEAEASAKNAPEESDEQGGPSDTGVSGTDTDAPTGEEDEEEEEEEDQ